MDKISTIDNVTLVSQIMENLLKLKEGGKKKTETTWKRNY